MSVEKKKSVKVKPQKRDTAPNITVKVDATFEQILSAGLNFNPKKKAQ